MTGQASFEAPLGEVTAATTTVQLRHGLTAIYIRDREARQERREAARRQGLDPTPTQAKKALDTYHEWMKQQAPLHTARRGPRGGGGHAS